MEKKRLPGQIVYNIKYNWIIYFIIYLEAI